uniref:(northern house mosquito) hypothetical protein n=1 Tax=Culex pipiens TaxID=7175 RepID=A0A8D8JCZ5_CULPI
MVKEREQPAQAPAASRRRRPIARVWNLWQKGAQHARPAKSHHVCAQKGEAVPVRALSEGVQATVYACGTHGHPYRRSALPLPVLRENVQLVGKHARAQEETSSPPVARKQTEKRTCIIRKGGTAGSER